MPDPTYDVDGLPLPPEGATEEDFAAWRACADYHARCLLRLAGYGDHEQPDWHIRVHLRDDGDADPVDTGDRSIVIPRPENTTNIDGSPR